ncbi:hypothetical protein B0T17DRAFT_590455 [Bombardia bombarda]|uniref:Vacuolar sorting protein Vps3844 C-terminal domain-containing protein n=1 Tax=Bombardia bombarda TaxID=252184 RepID=A0AA40C501_9PEZI|nr:hypothetical protein B0T17DRAFT_590455 [Bombardia bombarda]
MRFLTGATVAALSGLPGLAAAAASPQSADVFIFQADHHNQKQSSTETTRLPREVARHILLQRTARDSYGSDLRDIPSTIDTETAVSYLARFAKTTPPLFSNRETTDPSQLVVILEGVTAENALWLTETLAKSSHQAAFAISDPPSAVANTRLLKHFQNRDIASQSQCDLSSAINPFDTKCWTGLSSVVKYDIKKSPETVQTLVDNLARLQNFVSAGDLEAVVVLMPESSRSSKLSHWSDAAAGTSAAVRRRQESETVITDDTFETAATKVPAVSHSGGVNVQRAKPKSIPQCFTSFNTCMTQTGNCTSHGQCANKYGQNSKANCFVCACKSTVLVPGVGEGARGKTMAWGGNMCQKQDVSVPFWLITGFTITIIGAVSFAISLLFSIGEEPLPGVIGAGVIRGATK